MPEGTRPKLLDRSAAFVLAEGLAAATLRPLARAAGTSDRMLIYYFGSKDRLVAEILDHLARDLADRLAAGLPPPGSGSLAAELPAILALLRGAEGGPYVRLWFEILARGARGEAAFQAAAGRIVDLFLAWLAERAPRGEADPAGAARRMLALVEGILVLEAAGRRDVADAALAALLAAQTPAGGPEAPPG